MSIMTTEIVPVDRQARASDRVRGLLLQFLAHISMSVADSPLTIGDPRRYATEH